ncbi:hypothetical protein QL093DRAFT_2631785 [Fusarium oxysporum]|nr:hypothetical protein QL093DRAFT_2631785 [Fusarium oxysporum]
MSQAQIHPRDARDPRPRHPCQGHQLVVRQQRRANHYRSGRALLAGNAAHRHPPAKLALVISGRARDMLLDSYYEERQPLGKQVVDHAFTTLQNFALMPQALGFYHGQSQKEGFAKLQKLLSDVAGAEERRARLAEVIELQNRRSHALGLQLGQQYASVAVVQDGTSFPKHTRNAVLYYEPTTHPGEYLLNSSLNIGASVSLY